jgi:enoyl-CoA hydratase/carnithine racemase
MARPGESPVLYRLDGAVAIITLNRPESRNALNSALLDELAKALATTDGDDSVRVVVLTGSGPSFCAGADLKEIASAAERADMFPTRARAEQSRQLHESIPKMAKPVIAAVNGHAVAGGCGVAMSCDLVFASNRAVFGYPEVARGQVAAMVMASLTRVVGRRAALDLLFSARIIDAEEALSLGMINRVVDHDRLMDQTLAYAHQLAARSASAVRLTKDLFYRVESGDYVSALNLARDMNVLMRYTDDSRRGANEFSSSSR